MMLEKSFWMGQSLSGGGIELGAYLLAFVVLNGFGRKYSLMVYLFLSGILCVAAVSVQQFVPGARVT
jgi:hypothetical protein